MLFKPQNQIVLRWSQTCVIGLRVPDFTIFFFKVAVPHSAKYPVSIHFYLSKSAVQSLGQKHLTRCGREKITVTHNL